MAGDNIDFKVRVLGVKQLVELNNQIQATSKQLSEKKKALKTDEKGQQENMKSVLQLTDTLKKQRQEFREGSKQQQKVQTEGYCFWGCSNCSQWSSKSYGFFRKSN